MPFIFYLIYIQYLKKYKFFLEREFLPFDLNTVGSRIRGQTPPSYPNGWFRAALSTDLKNGEIQYKKINGRHIVVFRGQDGKAYVTSAYCTHMGANLAFGGKVKWNNCIECPFHGWSFHGKTGQCVNSDDMDIKMVSIHKYHDIKSMKKCENGTIWNKEGDISSSKLETFPISEMNGWVHVWFHSRSEHQNTPQYPCLDIDDSKFEFRGDSLDYVCAHIQEIPENGADRKHFEYVHDVLYQFLYPWVKAKWVPNERHPNAPDFYETMLHHDPVVRKYQDEIFKKYLSNKDHNKFYNCLNVDLFVEIFGIWKFKLQTANIIQVGAGTVYMFMKFKLFDLIVKQSVVPEAKTAQAVYHSFYTKKWVPYWLSTLMQKSMGYQLTTDKIIWKNKIFRDQVHYNLKGEADPSLYRWRLWYSQFYEGCHEYEKKQEELLW